MRLIHLSVPIWQLGIVSYVNFGSSWARGPTLIPNFRRYPSISNTIPSTVPSRDRPSYSQCIYEDVIAMSRAKWRSVKM